MTYRLTALTRLNHPFCQILDELDSLHAELNEAHSRGDLNPCDVAASQLELMRLFGRALAEMIERPRDELPDVAQL